MTFAKMIHNRRIEKQYTQEDVAKRSGLSVPYISALETGRRQAPLGRTLGKLSRALDIDLELLRDIAEKERGEKWELRKTQLKAAALQAAMRVESHDSNSLHKTDTQALLEKFIHDPVRKEALFYLDQALDDNQHPETVLKTLEMFAKVARKT